MLTELRLTGLGVIEDATIEPHAGFTVVTGETGAGKTMVVTALGLVAGGRADSSRVRAGADRAVVEARVALTPGTPPVSLVEEAGGRLDLDGSVILVRSVGADGRSRAHLGGRAVPLAALTDLTEQLVAVHGQSEAIALLRPGQQRALLDRFAGTAGLLETYRAARAEWTAAVAALAERLGSSRERAQREQLLRMGLDEIAAVAPAPGEDEQLVGEIRRLDNADGLRVAATLAHDGLVGDDLGEAASAVALVEAARKGLDGAGDPRLAELGTRLHATSAVLTDAAAELAGYLADLDADPARLEQLLGRQAELRALTRRYGADVAAVLQWQAEAEQELAGLDNSETAVERARELVADTARRTVAAAARLTAARTAAARTLADRATAELAHLAMGRATLEVRVQDRPGQPGADDALEVDGRWVGAGADGVDVVEVVMVAHAGAPPLPIARGASGGELSRVMLALEVVLADADPVSTLVFDEVDAGVGGRAATEIGRRLALLSRSHQVIVVTHLAQVAAFADRHVVVDAGAGGAVGTSSVHPVAGADRVTELARMLGGTDTETARAHAEDLLAAAAGTTSGSTAGTTSGSTGGAVAGSPDATAATDSGGNGLGAGAARRPARARTRRTA
ncbi:DNA repair protein RecN [Nakamurella endophytica]|uniref:DNA repair protein RecN n=1 Tax=Nakamurella endophytica TaxID=1748367 RepID=UPI00166E63AB|nr:DNA repair protein RecN [Nakamurella endophytica]